MSRISFSQPSRSDYLDRYLDRFVLWRGVSSIISAVIIAQIPALEPYALGIAKTTIVIIVTYLSLIFGELVPKRIGMGCAEKVSMLVAKPMNFLSLISSPLFGYFQRVRRWL